MLSTETFPPQDLVRTRGYHCTSPPFPRSATPFPPKKNPTSYWYLTDVILKTSPKHFLVAAVELTDLSRHQGGEKLKCYMTHVSGDIRMQQVFHC